ncbi:cytochrome oxidase biogenesis protein Surf1 [Vibrio ponticus]|nr:cytochrome oxidase biogenesis protein Surf1 [Vibrio ponticus]
MLLDNQTYNGEVGYLALQLVRAIDGRNVLLELGFVAAKSSRSDLPDVAC